MRKAAQVIFASVFLVFAAGASSVSAQQKTKKTPGPEAILLSNWNSLGDQVIAMAEDWPADKYDYRPNNQVRTFGQILLHLASWNEYPVDVTLGKSPKSIENDPKEYKTKAEIVAFVKKSFADGAAALKTGGDAGAIKNLDAWVGIIGHSNLHFGNLIVYYRNNGVVPPESRPKK